MDKIVNKIKKIPDCDFFTFFVAATELFAEIAGAIIFVQPENLKNVEPKFIIKKISRNTENTKNFIKMGQSQRLLVVAL